MISLKTRLRKTSQSWPKPLSKLNGLSQKQVADLIGKHQPIVSMWFGGKYLISANNLIKLADALGVDPEILGHELLSRWAARLRNKAGD